MARTDTVLEPVHLETLIEYLLTMIIRPTSDQMYTGKRNCSHVLLYVFTSSAKHTSMPRSRFNQAMNTERICINLLLLPVGKNAVFVACIMLA